MSRTRTTLTALLLTPALLAAGCSTDDPQPKFEATPSSEAPTVPSTQAADASSPDRAFGEWVRARNGALETGDTELVRALSSPQCGACVDAIEPIEQVHSAGGRFETDGWTVVSARIKSETPDAAEVSAAIRYEAGRTLPSASADPVAYDVERHIVLVELAAHDGGWLVEDLVYVS